MKKLTKHNDFQQGGFTLVELLIVIVIIGALMAYAIPSYQRQVVQSKRTEAQNILIELAAIQERHLTVFQQYATSIIGASETAASLGLASTSKYSNGSANYTITMGNANGYTLTATAKGNTQVNDTAPMFATDCTVITINATGVKSPTACWQ